LAKNFSKHAYWAQVFFFSFNFVLYLRPLVNFRLSSFEFEARPLASKIYIFLFSERVHDACRYEKMPAVLQARLIRSFIGLFKCFFFFFCMQQHRHELSEGSIHFVWSKGSILDMIISYGTRIATGRFMQTTLISVSIRIKTISSPIKPSENRYHI